METDPAARTAKGSRLLGLLADVSQEGAGLEALRREAAAFDPEEAVGSLLLSLLEDESAPAGFEAACRLVETRLRVLLDSDEPGGALPLLEGLARLEKTGPPDGARARRLRAARTSGFVVPGGGP